MHQSILSYFIHILLNIKYSGSDHISKNKKKLTFYQIQLYGLTEILNYLSLFDAQYNFPQTLLKHFLSVNIFYH
jgi:hypothetical protein